MAIQTGNKGKIFNEINITPLTDIFLVLLIIMMVMAPMFQAVDNNIKMPEVNSGINIEDEKVIVAVNKEGVFYVNGKQIVSDKLEDELNNLIKVVEKKLVVVKADRDTKNKEIMKIMRAAKATGYEKLTVAGEPLSRRQQDELKTVNKESKEDVNQGKVNLPE